MAFKGDTPGKKMARLETWRVISDALGLERFLSGRHLFLAGPDMGDASVLLGLGVPAERLLGVDSEKRAAAAAQWTFPQVTVQHEDVLHTIEREAKKEKFDAIFLDFCAPLLEKNLDTVGLALLEGLKRNGIVACAFLAGREQDSKGGVRTPVLAMRARVDQALKRLAPDERKKWEESLPYLARLSVIQKELLSRTRPYGSVPVPLVCIFYKSRTENERKSMPMCIYIARVVENSRLSVEDKLHTALKEPPEIYFFDPTPKELGAYAIKLIEAGYDPTLLFNTSKTTIAAWKAHATRGTYE